MHIGAQEEQTFRQKGINKMATRHTQKRMKINKGQKKHQNIKLKKKE